MLWTTIAEALLPQKIVANEQFKRLDIVRSQARDQANRQEVLSKGKLDKISTDTINSEKEGVMSVRDSKYSPNPAITVLNQSKNVSKILTAKGLVRCNDRVITAVSKIPGCCYLCGSALHKKKFDLKET